MNDNMQWVESAHNSDPRWDHYGNHSRHDNLAANFLTGAERPIYIYPAAFPDDSGDVYLPHTVTVRNDEQYESLTTANEYAPRHRGQESDGYTSATAVIFQGTHFECPRSWHDGVATGFEYIAVPRRPYHFDDSV